VEQDMPPLPLSKYHEPSLHTSEKVRLALEKLRLRSFEDDATTEPGTVHEPALAHKALTFAPTDRLYHDLVPIESEPTAPIVVPRPHAWKRKRKSIKQRQEETIEQHRMERLAKEVAAFEPAPIEGDKAVRIPGVGDSRKQSSRGRAAAAPAPHASRGKGQVRRSAPLAAERAKESSGAVAGIDGNNGPATSPAEQAEAQRAQARANEAKQDDSLTWLANYSLPWARKEFYLTRQDDGSVGFVNFRSLQ